MPTHTDRRPGRVRLAGLVGAAIALVVAVVATTGASSAHTESADRSFVPRTEAQIDFHDGMRKLWEDHITWTRLAIVAAVDDLPDTQQTVQRLLRNQDDIGAAVAPYYGDAAGQQLSTLLREHITIAVDVILAAKAGDTAAFEAAKTRWYVNGDEVADFLSAANPRFWPQDTMRHMMQMHLDQTLAEAAHRLQGDHAAEIADYDEVHTHILMMADLLSAGIIQQFPGRFA